MADGNAADRGLWLAAVLLGLAGIFDAVAGAADLSGTLVLIGMVLNASSRWENSHRGFIRLPGYGREDVRFAGRRPRVGQLKVCKDEVSLPAGKPAGPAIAAWQERRRSSVVPS